MRNGLPPSLDFQTLREAYRRGALRPADVIRGIYERISAEGRPGIWIHLRDCADAIREAEMLDEHSIEDLPLYGLPFGVKDNIDVAGMPTTSGCPEFSYTPAECAAVVARLRAAGAIVLGKTNLDQFATGLVGVRTPYGTAENPFDAGYIPGGSSSGSGVAVAAGQVSFTLGTDTAGSGRVPAACNNVVGVKPTLGMLSTRGVVPACRSLDCVSVFALTVEDASEVLAACAGFDEADAYSRKEPGCMPAMAGKGFRFGVPDALEFFGDAEAAGLFRAAVERLVSLGGEPVTIDFAPFRAAADLLYGPWVAERWEALRDFHVAHAGSFHPVTRGIIEAGQRVGAADLFTGLHDLAAVKRRAETEWARMDVLLVPTIASIYTVAEIAADPIGLNTRLGHYTNFVNLLDCAAVAVPSGFRANGLPFGVTLIAPAWSDAALSQLASRYHRLVGGPLGATGVHLSSIALPAAEPPPAAGTIQLAVVGAHLSGLALNFQLTEIGATLVGVRRTAPCYAFYALPDTVPAKPGLVRTSGDEGASIEVEVWAVPEARFGPFVAAVREPLGIGSVRLENGETVKGFLCESCAVEGAEEISQFGGWRNYLAACLPERSAVGV